MTELRNRIIHHDVTIQTIRVIRGHHGWAYGVEIELPDRVTDRRQDDGPTLWGETTKKWHTVYQCSSKELVERWLSVWINRPVHLVEDDMALLCPSTKEELIV